MGLDVVVITVLAGLAIRGYRQGFLKGSGALLTPVVALWFCLRYAHKLSSQLVGATGNAATSLALAILIILIVSFVGILIVRSLVRRLFERLRMLELDELLGGALGLFQATTILWVLIAFAFIAYPAGRQLICQAPIASQILLFGKNVPFLKRKMVQANRYVGGITNPRGQPQLPTLPKGASAPANPQALDGLDLGDDWR